MWLSKEQRKLLSFYAKKAEQPFGNCRVGDDELIKLLKFSDKERLHNIKKDLNKLGLISFTHLEKYEDSLNVNGRKVPINIEPNVTVTKEGFDLGIKYNSVFSPFNVWFWNNYKWFLPFIVTVIGIIVSIIIAVYNE